MLNDYFAVGLACISGLKHDQQDKCALCVKQQLVRRKSSHYMDVVAVSRKIRGKSFLHRCTFVHLFILLIFFKNGPLIVIFCI